MKIFLVSLAYLVVGLLLVPNPGETISSTLVFVLAMLGASRLSGVSGWRQFLEWGRSNPRQCFLTVAAAIAAGVMAAVNGVAPVRAVLLVPLAFAWFWLFTAVGTHLKERRLKKAVEAELANRAEAKGPGNAL